MAKVWLLKSYGNDIEGLEHSDSKIFHTKKRALSCWKEEVKHMLNFFLIHEETHFKESDVDEREFIVNKILSKAGHEDYLGGRFYDKKYLIVYMPDGHAGTRFSIMFDDTYAKESIERIVDLEHLLIND